MSSITELLQDLIYPALYNNITEALPEFRFKKMAGDKGYKAMSGAKIDGSTGEPEKVFIYANNIGRIVDFTRGSTSIWDYVQGGELTTQATLLKLAEMANVKLPERALSEEELERIAYYRKSAEIWEALNTFLIDSLSSKESNIAHSKEAYSVRKYLINSRAEGGRGLLPTEFRMPGVAFDKEANLVEFGFMPEPTVAYNHLMKQGYEETDLRKILRLTEDGRIGKDGYYLTLPYRDGSGSIRGLIIRNIQYNKANTAKAPKYLFTKSLEGVKGSLLYNLKPLVGDKSLLIVESQIDAAIASVKGLDNVVAIGGKNITEAQVKQALKKKPKSLTILLDNEKETIPQIKAAISAILSQEETANIFVAHIDKPEIKDLEEYLVAYGVEAFKANVLKGKTVYWRYLLNTILQEYGAKEDENNQLSPEDEEAFLEDVVRTANKIKSPIDRDRYNQLFTSLEPVKEMGISSESLAATQEKLSYKADREAQAKDFKKLLSEVTQLQNKGDINKALELLDSKVKEVKLKDKATEFSSLLLPIKETELKERVSQKPESIKSGYTIGGEELHLPSGAISILTAPTSHGKTTFLINMALNVAQAYPDKEAYLFSYEEDGDSILINALNTYLDVELSSNNRRTLKSYFTTGSTEYVRSQSKDYFTTTKDKFFRELIDTRRLNITYSSYNSDTLIEAIRYLHKHANPGAIFIDYIQLLNLPEGKYKTYSRQEEIKEICIALKDVAIETGLPIILGAQFNREVVNQLRLHATKIGEAGDIERIANLIVGFWNNNFKPLASEGEINEINNKGAATPDTLYTTILKNRGGRVGLEEILSFNGNTGKIKNSSSSDSNYFS